MAGITIRKAGEGDIPRITEIYADAVDHGTATYELDAPGAEEMLERYRGLHAAGYPYLVVEEGERILAYAYAGPFRARPAYRFIVEDSIYVAPEGKGRGIGKALLTALIDQCKALGFRQFVAVIGDGGPDSASVRLHERLGFDHCGVLRGSGYKHGRWLDTTFMQLEMNGGTSAPPDPQSLPERMFRGAKD